MPTQVRLFISGGPDQEAARELLGRSLAELPVNVGWVIKRTPDVDSVAESHVMLLLLGSDIWAPVGPELYWARRTEKPVFAYRSTATRTPAGHVFVQENSDLAWTTYADLPALRRVAMKNLGYFVLEHAARYGLTLPEMEALSGYLAGLDKSAPPAAPEKARGAAGGGVILAPGKDQPPGSRILGEE